jgi:hypothetical protein
MLASRTIPFSQLVNSLGFSSEMEVMYTFWLYTYAVLVSVVHLCGSEVLLSSGADLSRNNPNLSVFSSTQKLKPQRVKKKATTTPLQGLSEYHQWMTAQDTSLEQIYLLLQIIESSL